MTRVVNDAGWCSLVHLRGTRVVNDAKARRQ